MFGVYLFVYVEQINYIEITFNKSTIKSIQIHSNLVCVRQKNYTHPN